jgi:hypothetical protein
MPRAKPFRPVIGDTLEDRTVPSGFFGNGLGNLIGLGPTAATQAVHKAVQTFEQSYSQDVFNVLYKSGTTPTAQRSAFDTQVGTDLQTLQTSINTAIANLPTATTLTTTVDGELTGSASTSLQSELKAIATPTSTMGRGFFFGGPWRFLATSEWDIAQVSQQVSQQVQSASAPVGSIDVSTVQTILGTVDTAFGTFSSSYFKNDVKGILLKTGTTPSAQQSAFNTAVGTDISTLVGSVTGALTASGLSTPLPPSVVTSLTTKLTADLQTPSTGATGASLQEKLAALPLPTTSFFSTLWFRLGSSWTISRAESQVFSDIISAVKTYNVSLSPPATTTPM